MVILLQGISAEHYVEVVLVDDISLSIDHEALIVHILTLVVFEVVLHKGPLPVNNSSLIIQLEVP